MSNVLKKLDVLNKFLTLYLIKSIENECKIHTTRNQLEKTEDTNMLNNNVEIIQFSKRNKFYLYRLMCLMGTINANNKNTEFVKKQYKFQTKTIL